MCRPFWLSADDADDDDDGGAALYQYLFIIIIIPVRGVSQPQGLCLFIICFFFSCWRVKRERDKEGQREGNDVRWRGPSSSFLPFVFIAL